MAFLPVNRVPFGLIESAPVIPKLYWDVTSQEQRVKRLCEKMSELFDYSKMLAVALNADTKAIEELQAAFKKFMESGFDDYYKEQLVKYINDHFPELMHTLLNQGVFFGLSDDGYFVANVLMQLTIYFDTVMDYSSNDYGKLTLTY